MHEHEPHQEVTEQESIDEQTIRTIARVVIPYAGTEPVHEEPHIIHQVNDFRANLPA